MSKVILIMAGGSVGALLRYGVSGFAQKFAGPHLIREEYRMALLVGLLGAFTTFSTFGIETFSLANDGQFRLAAANILLSNGLGLGALWFGYRLSEKWFGV